MEYLLIPAIAFLAFVIKGMTGTGTSTVIVALCALVIDPKMAVVLASFVNVFGGLMMLRVDPVPLPYRYWIPIALTMIGGSFIGAFALAYIDPKVFELILGFAFLCISAYFVFVRVSNHALRDTVPSNASAADLAVGAFAGFCGGFIAVNAPPLVYHFSKVLNKKLLRRLLVIIFIPAAIVQTATFYWNGLLTMKIVMWGLLTLPAMAALIYCGNRIHGMISEQFFRYILGVFLVMVSIKLML